MEHKILGRGGRGKRRQRGFNRGCCARPLRGAQTRPLFPQRKWGKTHKFSRVSSCHGSARRCLSVRAALGHPRHGPDGAPGTTGGPRGGHVAGARGRGEPGEGAACTPLFKFAGPCARRGCWRWEVRLGGPHLGEGEISPVMSPGGGGPVRSPRSG